MFTAAKTIMKGVEGGEVIQYTSYCTWLLAGLIVQNLRRNRRVKYAEIKFLKLMVEVTLWDEIIYEICRKKLFYFFLTRQFDEKLCKWMLTIKLTYNNTEEGVFEDVWPGSRRSKELIHSITVRC